MWWTRTFNKLHEAIKFLNDWKIKNMQILEKDGEYTVIYFTKTN